MHEVGTSSSGGFSSRGGVFLYYLRMLGNCVFTGLHGHGAQDFARSHDVEVVPGEDLVSDRARADWEYWSAQLRGESLAETVPQAEGHASQRLDAHQDTVGAVCLHFPSSGLPSAAAGVSR